MDDFDIYSDLPDFKWLKDTYDEDVDIKKEELPISEDDVKKLKEQFLKLVKVHKLVLSHYSSLWKTCKQERKRMDRQIADLRSQLDNFAFKRNHHRHNAVPPPVTIKSLVACPPPLLSINPFLMQNVNQGNLYSYPPPSTNPDLDTNQEWNEQEQKLDENFVDNLAVPSNVITPENSHSSDESDDDIVKKSHYRSTVYGERLRKKLLEEKRSAIRQKQESVLNEKKVNQEQLEHSNQNELGNVSGVNKIHVSKENEVVSIKREIDTKPIEEENSNKKHIETNVKKTSQQEQLKHQKQIESKNVNGVNNPSVLKEAEVTSIKKETDVRTLKEENNDRRQSKIETQIVKEPLKQEQKLRNQKENETKENKKEDQLRIKRDSDDGRKKREEDLRTSKENDTDKKRKNDDFNFRRERDVSKKIGDDELKMRRERNLERRKRDDESGSRRERDLDRRRKEEEIEKLKREEQLEKRRRQEDAEKRRKDQEAERRKKEEIDKRRRAEIVRRRKDEEIERRKRDEFDRRRKEEEEKKRKERELEIFKQKENDRRRKEEEQHLIRLKEIEKKRNEKQLEELIKERKRIENEMNTLTDDESEKEEKPLSSKDTSRREHSSIEKSEVSRGKSKETTKDNSMQVHKKQSDNKKNDESKAGQRSCENRYSSSANANSQTINSNHRKECHEHASSKSDRQQDNHTTHDKHKYNVRRSRRDQLDHELERRNSSHRNKSRHRNKSNSACRSDEDNYSPKRIKRQEKDKGYRDRLENLGADDQSKKKMKSPKRKRQSKSNEKSPQKSKKRKISQGRDLDCNIKLDENTISKTNVSASKEIDKAHKVNNENISNNCMKSSISTILKKSVSTHTISTKSDLTENATNVGDSLKKEKEQFTAPFGKNEDEMSTNLTNLQTGPQVASKTEDQVIDLNRDNKKLTNSVADKISNNHANKKKTLMNELFEAQEEPVNTPANSENVKQIDKTLNETILSELEDGEITDSDESMDSKGLQKSTSQATIQPKEKPMETIPFTEKSNNNKEECSASLQKINKLAASKCTSEIEDSILYNMLVQSKNDSCQEKSKIESHENVSIKTEPVILKNNKKAEACKNKNANKADDKSSFHSETNNVIDVCMKENVDVNNDFIKRIVGPSTIAENLNKEVLKPVAKIETASKDNAAGNLASQIKVPIRNVIVIKRRRRPVKLSDSPPVVVINNINVKTR